MTRCPLPLRRASSILACIYLVMIGCGSSQAEADEAADIVRWLELAAGESVADVGAGDGEWTVPLAEKVGPDGHIWATEVTDDLVEKLRQEMEDANLSQVKVVLGDQEDLGLPAGCCDALLLRLVYHHFTEPGIMRQALRAALKPGARLLVIDIEPQKHWPELDDVPDRGGHGIPIDELALDLTRAGFREVKRETPWQDDEDRYALLFVSP